MAAAGSRLLTPKPVPLWAEGRETDRFSQAGYDAADPVRVHTAKVNPGVEARCQLGLPPVG